MLELNKVYEIIRKNQVFGPKILHNTIHGKRMLGYKMQAQQGYG